jgi:hypothetical protein
MPAPKLITEEMWDGIWNKYITGLTTTADIAREFGVSESSIRTKAKEDGWTRDLAGQINAKAAKITAMREAATESAARRKELADSETVEKLPAVNPNEEQIVEIVATNQVNIVFQEREDVAIARSVATKLYTELSGQIEEGQKLDELMSRVDEMEDASYNQKTFFKKRLEHIIGFGGRVDSCLKLANALKTLIELERKVNKINDTGSEEETEKRVKLNVSFGK